MTNRKTTKTKNQPVELSLVLDKIPAAESIQVDATGTATSASAGSPGRPWAWVRVPMFKWAHLHIKIHDDASTSVTRVERTLYLRLKPQARQA